MSRNLGDIPINEPLAPSDLAGWTEPETGLAKDATLKDGTQVTEVSNWPDTLDGVILDAVNGNGARVKAATPLSNDYGVVTRNIPSGTQDVAVSNFPSTQAVTGPVTDAQMRATPVPVSVNNFPATQTVAGTVTANGPLTDAQLRAAPLLTREQTVTPQTQTGTAGQAVTLTLSAVAGQTHRIASIEITKYAVAALAGSATPVVVTTTNLNSLAFTFETAQAIGTVVQRKYEGPAPVQAQAVGAATTIVCPAVTNVIWRITVYFYTA